MSQPFNRDAVVSSPGKLDASLKEFWVSNPWQTVAHGHNLSCFERNRAYLNLEGQDFLDISHLTGADSDGDGRSVVAADLRNIGQLDLLVRQAGGGALLLFENQLPPKRYLKVTLRGRNGNRQGIGARLTLLAGGHRQTRELYPANGFYSQSPSLVHFGMGEAPRVDSLTVRWPSGRVQVLKDLAVNQHLLIDEHGAEFEVVVPGKQMAP